MSYRSMIVALLIAFSAASGWTSVQAQGYPTKPVRIVVPNQPGATADAMVRIMGPHMAMSLGQPVVIENKAGAGSIIGYEYVAKQAPADGYAIVVSNHSTLAILAATTKELRFDPLTDLPPIIGLSEGQLMLVSSSKFPWKTLNEMAAYAKANPGKLNYGSGSVVTQLPAAAVARELGLDVVHVPYSASATSFIQGIVSAEVQFALLAPGIANSLGDRLRGLAVTGERRLPQFPDVPTFTELNMPKIRGLGYAFNARAGTPKPVTDKVLTAASYALQQVDVRDAMGKLGLQIVEQGPELARKRLADDGAFFADISRKVGIQSQ